MKSFKLTLLQVFMPIKVVMVALWNKTDHYIFML